MATEHLQATDVNGAVQSSMNGSIFVEGIGSCSEIPSAEELALFGVWQSTVHLISALHAARPDNEHYRSLDHLSNPNNYLQPTSSRDNSNSSPSQPSSPTTDSSRRPSLFVSLPSPSSAPTSPPQSPRTSFSTSGANLFRRATRRPAPQVRTKSANDAPTPAPGLLPGGLGRVAAKSWDPVVSRPGSAQAGSVGMDLVVGSAVASTSALADSPVLGGSKPGPRKLRKAGPAGKGGLRVRTDEATLAAAAAATEKGKEMSASPEVMTAYAKHSPSITRARSPLANGAGGHVEFTSGYHPCHTRESNSSGDSYHADSENVRPAASKASSRTSKERHRTTSQPASPSTSSGWANLFKRQQTQSTSSANGRLPRSHSSNTSLSSWDMADNEIEPTVSGAPSAKAASKKSSFEVMYRGPEAKITQRRPSNPLLKSSASEHSLSPSTVSLASVKSSASGVGLGEADVGSPALPGLARRRTGSTDLLAVGASTDELGQIDEQPEPTSPPNAQPHATISASSSLTVLRHASTGLADSNTPTPIPSPRASTNRPLAPLEDDDAGSAAAGLHSSPGFARAYHANARRWQPTADAEEDDDLARSRSHSVSDSLDCSVGESSWRCSEGEGEDTPASSADAGDDDDEEDEHSPECGPVDGVKGPIGFGPGLDVGEGGERTPTSEVKAELAL